MEVTCEEIRGKARSQLSQGKGRRQGALGGGDATLKARAALRPCPCGRFRGGLRYPIGHSLSGQLMPVRGKSLTAPGEGRVALGTHDLALKRPLPEVVRATGLPGVPPDAPHALCEWTATSPILAPEERICVHSPCFLDHKQHRRQLLRFPALWLVPRPPSLSLARVHACTYAHTHTPHTYTQPGCMPVTAFIPSECTGLGERLRKVDAVTANAYITLEVFGQERTCFHSRRDHSAEQSTFWRLH